MNFPETRHLLLELSDGVLHATINRPEARNAMNNAMLEDLDQVFDAIADDRSVRVVVLRGAEANFCSGGDIKEMAQVRFAPVPEDGNDPIADFSRRFGYLIRKVNKAPQAVITVLEGAVMGGGFGLACVSDIAIAHRDAKFGLPETTRGIPPAQIAPFVVERIGLTQARRLGVCGGHLTGQEALELGLVHYVAADEKEISGTLEKVIAQIRRCAPGANAVTKDIMLSVGHKDMDQILNEGAEKFAQCIRGDEGVEGTTAFVEKRKPKWAS